MKNERVWKRKRWVISPGFQWTIVLKTVLFTALVTAIFGWFTFYFTWKHSLTSGNLSQVTLLYQPELWLGWGGCLLLCIFVVILVLLKMTHRVAGQMYRFEKTLDEVLQGQEASRIFTRKSDYFHDFEAGLNRFLNLEN